MSKSSLNTTAIIYPAPPVLVSCKDKISGTDNIITIAWTGIISSDPLAIYISIRQERFSYDIISNSKEFVINLVPSSLVNIVDSCGISSGRDINKFETFGLTKEAASTVNAPLIKQCPINIECVVTEIKKFGSHDMFIAKITNINIDDIYLDENKKINLEKCTLLTYLHGSYYELGRCLGKFGFSLK